MAQDKNAQMRNLIVGYCDPMMLERDIKALIAVLFVAIMMGTVLQYRAHYPWYLYPAGHPFSVSDHLPELADFGLSGDFPAPGGAVSNLAQRGAEGFLTLSPTLRPVSRGLPRALRRSVADPFRWKNITLLTANLLSITCLAATVILLFVGWL